MKCANCLFELSAAFAFCPGCGIKVAAAAEAPSVTPHADRRMATVLFADLSGFTSISERLDPEDVRALQTDLFAVLREAVERYGGFVEKFVGDAPLAHEDDPQRAVRTALDMHEGRTRSASAGCPGWAIR